MLLTHLPPLKAVADFVSPANNPSATLDVYQVNPFDVVATRHLTRPYLRFLVTIPFHVISI